MFFSISFGCGFSCRFFELILEYFEFFLCIYLVFWKLLDAWKVRYWCLKPG